MYIFISIPMADRQASQIVVGGRIEQGGTTRGAVTSRSVTRSAVPVQIQTQQNQDLNFVRQDLLVISGGRACLTVSSQVPEMEWIWNFGVTQGYWTGTMQWKDVGSSLLVEPTVIEDRIRLRLTPQLSYLLGGERRIFVMESLMTEVVVSDGQEVDLGGVQFANQEFRSRFLTGISYGGERRALRIRLLPKIE